MRRKIIEKLSDICQETDILENLDYDLFQDNMLDSFAFISLLNYLEDEFSLVLQPTQIPRENFQTPRKILHLVAELLSIK